MTENAKRLAEAYSDVPLEASPGFYVSIQRDNQDQICAIAELAHSLGIRRFGCGIVTAPAEFFPQQDGKLCHELERAYSFLDRNRMLCDLYPAKVGDYLLWGDRYEPLTHFILDTNCNAPLTSAAIAYSGDVYLCCNAGAKAGDIRRSGFLDLWGSAHYNELRRLVNDPERMPGPCRCCAWANRN